MLRPAQTVYDGLTAYSPTRGVAFILGLGMFAWGFWVALPFESFNNPVYQIMQRYAQESVWGALFLFGGFTMLVGVWIKDIEWIRRGAFIGFVLWMIMAVLGFIAEPSATPVVTRSIIALMHGWIYLQVKVHPQLITGEVRIDDLKQMVNERDETHG